MSRPRTLAETVIRRWPHSRVIVDGPSTTRMSASRDSGNRSPEAVGIKDRANAADAGAHFLGQARTTSGNRNWPSITSPSGLLPIDSMMSVTTLAGTP